MPLKRELEIVPTGIADPNPEFSACSPFKKMPAFSDGDFRISDSTAIITYLEAKYPEPVLIPADLPERARTIWFDEFADTMIAAYVEKMHARPSFATSIPRERKMQGLI